MIFLGAMTEATRPPGGAARRFEAMVEEVARRALEASRNATAAGQASERAQTSAGQAAESATAAVNAAGRQTSATSGTHPQHLRRAALGGDHKSRGGISQRGVG